MLYARPPRRRPEDAEPSFDSLLDAMTNVVGILVIILVVTQLGVKEAVERIDASLPDISAEQLEAIKKELEDTKKLKAEIEDDAAKLPQPPINNDELKQKVEKLKQQAQADPMTRELEKLLKELAEQKKLNKAIEDELRKLQEEYQKLLVKLKRTPDISGASAPAIVQLPNPREAPKNATAVYVLVKEGRIAVVDAVGMKETLHERILKAPTAVGAERPDKDQRDGKKHIEVDRDKLKTFVSQLGLGKPMLDVSFRYVHEKRWKHLLISIDERAGETMKQINLPSSRFQSQLRTLKGKPIYFRYLVDRNSFELYLKARQMSERAGIPAGWLLSDGKEWATGIPWQVKIRGELPPPPPDPNAPKPKPKPNLQLD